MFNIACLQDKYNKTVILTIRPVKLIEILLAQEDLSASFTRLTDFKYAFGNKGVIKL